MAIIPYEINDPIEWQDNQGAEKPDRYTPCILNLTTPPPKEIGESLYYWNAKTERWYPRGMVYYADDDLVVHYSYADREVKRFAPILRRSSNG